MQKRNEAEIQQLYRAILSLKTVEECADFFDDACTIQEIESMAQRLEVACQLDAGKSYVDVNRDTGVSTATICRVNKCLNYGNGGYKRVIDRLKSDEK